MSNEAIREIIGSQAAKILDAERAALARLVELLDSVEPDGAAARSARLVLDHLDEFFLLVVVGEVKSGKSSFINALLGEEIQPEGPLPLTDRIYVLRHGDEPSERIRDEFVTEKRHPNPLLKLFHIVDTPGTNSIIKKHQEITESFIPKADLTLFVSSIDRPFSESEHRFLDYISERWRRKVVFVLTKVDSHEPGDVPEVAEYIRENCRRFYGFEPRVFPVSAKTARSARGSSGLEQLTEFLETTLSEHERVQLKLTAPAEAGLALLDELNGLAAERRRLLEADFRSLKDLDAQVAQAAAELKERYNVFVVRLYDLLREFERRGRNFFETAIRVKNFGLLKNQELFQRRFEKEAIGDLREKIQETMHAATDWLMKEQIGLFERSLLFLNEHIAVARYKDRVAAGQAHAKGFDYNRDVLVRAMQDAFKREIERFDVEGECNRVTETAYRGILQQLGVQAGAVTLGALLVSILTGVALDITGLLAAGMLFAAGFVILPRKKRRAIHEFSLKVDALIREFRHAVGQEFDREIDKAQERLKAAYEPFLTFYRAETAFLAGAGDAEKEVRVALLEVLERARNLAPETPGGGAAS